jgi:hypothetical protein
VRLRSQTVQVPAFRFQTARPSARDRGTLPGLLVALTLLALPNFGGCRSASVEADIRNASGQPISLLELDYPSASFGTQSLAANSVYQYRFNVIGSGPSKVLWTDALHKDHSVTGPTLQEGDHGTLLVAITASGATWTAHLQP